MGRLVRPVKKKIFAIAKCETSNPLLPDVYGVVYTQVYISRNKIGAVDKHWVVCKEITKEEALALIERYEMTKVVHNKDGALWETTPSLRSECQRLGLTYTADLRPF